MKQLQVTVSQRRSIGPVLWELQVSAPELRETVLPGQFFLAAGPSYLRRPLFPAHCGAESLAFFVKAGPDAFVAWLAGRATGDLLNLIGPLGHGFDLPRRGQHVLLVAETAADVGPLLGLAESALACAAEVVLATGATHAAAVFPAQQLPAAVELQVATADGSLGRRGDVASLLPHLVAWADRVYAVGLPGLYRALQQASRPPRAAGSVQVLLADIAMACGVGACQACTIETPAGLRQVCNDGPVFAVDEILLP